MTLQLSCICQIPLYSLTLPAVQLISMGDGKLSVADSKNEPVCIRAARARGDK